MQNLGNNPNNLTHPAYVKKQCVKEHCNGLSGIDYRYCRAGYCGKGTWSSNVGKCIIQPWKKNAVQRYQDKEGTCRTVLRHYRPFFFSNKYTTPLRQHIKECWIEAMSEPKLYDCVAYSTALDPELNKRIKENYYFFMNGAFNVWRDSNNIKNTPYGYCLFSMSRKMKTCTFKKIRGDRFFVANDVGSKNSVDGMGASGRGIRLNSEDGKIVPTEPVWTTDAMTIWPSEGDDWVA